MKPAKYVLLVLTASFKIAAESRHIWTEALPSQLVGAEGSGPSLIARRYGVAPEPDRTNRGH